MLIVDVPMNNHYKLIDEVDRPGASLSAKYNNWLAHQGAIITHASADHRGELMYKYKFCDSEKAAVFILKYL